MIVMNKYSCRKLIQRFIRSSQGTAAIEFLFASIVLIAILFFMADFMRLRTDIAKLNQASYTVARILANRTTYFSRGILHSNKVYVMYRRGYPNLPDDNLPPPNVNSQTAFNYMDRTPTIWDFTSLSRFNLLDTIGQGPGGMGVFLTRLCERWWEQGARYDCLMRGYYRPLGLGDQIYKDSFTISDAGTINPHITNIPNSTNGFKGIRILDEFRKIVSLILTNTEVANPRIYLEESFGYPCTVRKEVLEGDDGAIYPNGKYTTTRYDENPSQYQASDAEYCGGGIFIDEHGKEGYISRAKVSDRVDFFNDLGPKIAPYAEWTYPDMLNKNAVLNFWKGWHQLENKVNEDIEFVESKKPRKIPVYRATVCIPKPKGIFIFFFSAQQNTYMFNDNLCSSSIAVAR